MKSLSVPVDAAAEVDHYTPSGYYDYTRLYKIQIILIFMHCGHLRINEITSYRHMPLYAMVQIFSFDELQPPK